MRSGDVTVELRPELKKGKLVVSFAANTHTENLSGFDLAESAVLEYAGKRVAPSRADRLRGHHAFGKMEFEVAGSLRDFRIVITGISGRLGRLLAKRLHRLGEYEIVGIRWDPDTAHNVVIFEKLLDTLPDEMT